MRIICPNCASHYEIPKNSVPKSGRNVQCTNCTEIWLQDAPMQLTKKARLEPKEPITENVSELENSKNSEIFKSQRNDKIQNTLHPSKIEKKPSESKGTNTAELSKARPSLTPEIKLILQDEAIFASKIKLPGFDTKQSTNTIKDPLARIEALNVNLDSNQVVRRVQKIDFVDMHSTYKQKTNLKKICQGFLTAITILTIATSLYIFTPRISYYIPEMAQLLNTYETRISSTRLIIQDMYYLDGEPGFHNLFNSAMEKITLKFK